MSSGVPYYLGISDNSLKERMDNYKAGKEGGTAGSTNKKVHTKILEFLKNYKEVKIYILQPKYQLEYEGFEINIAKGIEHSLIKQFDSEDIWNERGSSKSKKVPVSSSSSGKKQPNNPTLFQLNRGKEFNKGWIIFGNGAHDHLPDRSCDVKLTIGANTSAETCRFTHSGNNRKINGGQKLIRWISELKEDDKVFVEIMNKREFKVYSSND